MVNYVSYFRAVNTSANANQVEEVPNGIHTLRIESAEDTVSSKGNEMIKVRFSIEGYSTPCWHYLMLNYSTEEDAKKTNSKISRFMFNFGITFGDFGFHSWKGKTGKAELETESGNKYPRVKFWEHDNNAFAIAVADYNADAPENFKDDEIPF